MVRFEATQTLSASCSSVLRILRTQGRRGRPLRIGYVDGKATTSLIVSAFEQKGGARRRLLERR